MIEKYILVGAQASLSSHAHEKNEEAEREGKIEESNKDRENYRDRKRGRREADEAQLRGSEGWSRQNRKISMERKGVETGPQIRNKSAVT